MSGITSNSITTSTHYRFIKRIFGILVCCGSLFCIRAILFSNRPIQNATSSGTSSSSVGTKLGHHETALIEDALVDCSQVDEIQPVNLGKLFAKTGETTVSFTLSLSWWDGRLKNEELSSSTGVYGNPNVDVIAGILLKEEGALLDIGANVGFMTNLALRLNRTVYAFEPISYNIAKLCEGYRHAYAGRNLFLYKAIGGTQLLADQVITRPSDEIGFFDQSSIARDNIAKAEVTEEIVPMISVDGLFSGSNHHKHDKILVVKIDVQGFEHTILQGMHLLLSNAKTTGYPKYVFYESDANMMFRATKHSKSETQQLVESYGYSCVPGADTLCTLK